MASLMLSAFVFTVASVMLLVAFAAYAHHKKGAVAELSLIGRRGQVEVALAPEGAVMVGGEVWRARALNDAPISCGRAVRVCGTRGHLLIVELL